MKLNKKQTRLLIKSLCVTSTPFLKKFVNKDGELVITEKRLEVGWKKFKKFYSESVKKEKLYGLSWDMPQLASYSPLVHYRAFIEHTIEIFETNTFGKVSYSNPNLNTYDRYDPTSFKRMTKKFLKDLESGTPQ